MITDPYRLIYISVVSSLVLGLFLILFRFVYPKKKIKLFPLLILISILPIISIFRSGTYQAGDLTTHTVILQSFYSNLSQGNWFPRWAGELCGGYGCPAHMFEYPLPYYFASFYHFLGFGYLNSMKLFLASAYVLSGITMFLWLRDEVGEVPAFVGSLLYLFAPYHFADIHFRVSVGEVLSYVPLPLIFLFLRRFLLTRKISYFLLVGLSVGLLIMSHPNTMMSAAPLIFFYILYLIKDSKNKIRKIAYSFSAILLGFLFTAFYWIPTIFEIRYTWYSISFSVDDFKPLLQYIYSPERFGLLFQGHNGELRLIIGYVQILFVILAIYYIYKKKISSRHKMLLYSFLLVLFIYFFMLLGVSKPIWNILPFFKTFILPWRLLIPIAFAIGTIGAIITKSIKNKKVIYILCFLTIFLTTLNWGNRMMVPFEKDAFYSHIWGYTEYYEDSKSLYVQKQKTDVAKEAAIVANRPKNYLVLLSGKGITKQIHRENILHRYLVSVGQTSILTENTNYFPGWHIYANGKEIPINYENKLNFGRPVFNLPKGNYLLEVRFEDTKIRKFSKIISLISFLTLLFFIPDLSYFISHKSKYLLTKSSHV